MTKIKGFFVNPVETFRQSKDDGTGTVVWYFCALLLVNALMSAVIVAAGFGSRELYTAIPYGSSLPVMVFFIILIGGFIATLLLAAWFHLLVFVVGGRRGIMQTVHAVFYGSTPRLLLGWIPFFGFIFSFWSLVLAMLGIREFQDLSTGKAVLAVAIALIIPFLLIVLAAAYFMTSVMTVTPVPVNPGFL